MNIPKFIKIRGCINCRTSKKYKEKTGKDYGFDHELMASCVVLGCRIYGVELCNPFIDPEEVVNEFRKLKESTEDYQENIMTYVLNVKKRFGEFYEQIGVSLDDLINSI
ncbi:MAG: hypothetical protein ABIB79_02000 [archaeon]